MVQGVLTCRVVIFEIINDVDKPKWKRLGVCAQVSIATHWNMHEKWQIAVCDAAVKSALCNDERLFHSSIHRFDGHLQEVLEKISAH